MSRFDYWKNKGDEQIVCYCTMVDKKTIVKAIKEGANSISKIQKATSACTGNRCKELNPSGKCCSADIKTLIQIYSKEEQGDSNIDGACCSDGGCCGGSGGNPK